MIAGTCERSRYHYALWDYGVGYFIAASGGTAWNGRTGNLPSKVNAAPIPDATGYVVGVVMEERKQFDIPSVLRILENICQKSPGQTEACQEAAHRRFTKMGLPVDLQETKRLHRLKCFHDDAEIILVADDGMRFTRFNGCWIVGTDETKFLLFRVKPQHIEHIRADRSIEIVNG